MYVLNSVLNTIKIVYLFSIEDSNILVFNSSLM